MKNTQAAPAASQAVRTAPIPQASPATAPVSKCRFCSEPLTNTFVDLGMSPLCESFVPADKVRSMEAFYPLHVYVCTQCWLVQLEEFVTPDEIFTEYAYFSSYADSWVRHAKNYVHMVKDRFALGPQSQVVEIASNDGYLLQHFLPLDVPVLGIEPAANVAKVAVEKGIPSLVQFFGVNTAKQLVASGTQADLLLGNNVLAHVPDINDFVGGMKVLLKPTGVITMEFPHLVRLVERNQFDTIYHEHFSYLSLVAVERIFSRHGLTVFDVDEIPTHGGSIRIYARHAENSQLGVTERIENMRKEELSLGLEGLEYYSKFSEQVKETKRGILSFFIDAKRQGKSIAAYGAPGKGNTLLNYCAIREDFLDFVVDRNPYKHGRYTPGTHIPIYPPEKINEAKPDFVFILPWNVKEEVMEQMAHIRDWGGRFVVPIPEITVY